MAKKKMSIPKKIAGFKVPKAVRKSSLVQGLLNSASGRDMLGQALIAGAAAAATALAQPEDVAAAGKAVAKGGRKAGGVAGRALKDAANAMVGVLSSLGSSSGDDEGAPKLKLNTARGSRRTAH